MKAYEIQNFDLDSLKMVERPTPEPGYGQILVSMKAASLNFRDLMTVLGHYNPKQPLPLVPLSDGAGVVEAVGPGVEQVKVGDRVCSSFFQRWLAGPPSIEKCAKSSLGGPLDGCLAQSVLLSSEGVAKIPDWMSFEEAATLPCAALTAWNALMDLGSLKAGDRVLVLGTGGVSIFALQIAHMMGAEVIATSSSDAKLERAKQLGAAHGINYKTTPDWGKAVLDLTGKQGVDYVIEVGGAGTMERSLQAVRMGGMVATIGILSGVAERLNLLPVLMKQARVQGVFVGSAHLLKEMIRAFDLNKVHPVIDKVYPFEEAVAALRHMQSGAHVGKLVINCES